MRLARSVYRSAGAAKMALEGANNEPVVLVKDTEGRLQDSEVERTSIGLPSPLDVLFLSFFFFT
jgi:hypothetical protein